MMSGDIAVESKLGDGSTFVFRMPRFAAQTAEAEKSSRPATEASRPSGPDTPDNLRVLVVDDDRNARELMRVMLAREGYDVITAASGREGLELARKFDPSVITLDAIMPGLDGWDYLKEIKADPETASIPVIMVTMVDDAERGFALGASEYLTKPVNRNQLKELLNRYCAGDQIRDVLVVEDDPVGRDLLRDIFSGAGWRVTEAENGSVAIECLTDLRPDLIMLDLLMPQMDGFEFLERLRQFPDFASVPVVVLTAADLTPEDHRRLNGGVQQVIQKNGLKRRDLLRKLSQLISWKVHGKVEASVP
jgi:CheY-like chemotaxis protein